MTTFVRCECGDPECRCVIDLSKAVMRGGKAFCTEGCAVGKWHACGCNRGLCPNSPIL
ncbi:hypothetical protein [Synechococcus sp. MIT S9504]|nr:MULTISPECIES: hypothetical protein [unclassified Synechococcus]